MNWLITADLHLTDRPKDEYRFGLFKWLQEQQRKHAVTATFLLGDLSDIKDRHSSALVNRIVDELTGLRPPVYILKGNHDYIDPNNPFFRFLNCVDGIEFISEPSVIEGCVALLPHCHDQAEFDNACKIVPQRADAVFLHACIEGALAETGAHLSGLRASIIEAKRPKGCWAGDIHRPQRLACGVTYVGSPYHVRFGDAFNPRVLLVKNGKEQNLHFPAPRKWSLRVRDAEELASQGMKRGDQAKITLELAREEAVEWATHKQRVLSACKELGVDVYGVELHINSNTPKEQVRLTPKARSHSEIFTAFCEAENTASGIRQAGFDILNG